MACSSLLVVGNSLRLRGKIQRIEAAAMAPSMPAVPAQ
jgi:hypothetical protein